jgi:hypothetical protein
VVGIALAFALAPQPSASPLKQIIEVRSRTLCQTLTERVEPAVAGLMKNDQVIEAGQRRLRRASADQASGASPEFDRFVLSNVALVLNRNLLTIDAILDDPARFPLQPKSDDERTAADIKGKLLDLVRGQKLLVNALYGLVETQNLGDMQTNFGEHNITSSSSSPPLGPQPFATLLAVAGLQNPVTVNMPALMDQDLIGKTAYDALANLIAVHQLESASAENAAVTEIGSVVASCRASSPAPSP